MKHFAKWGTLATGLVLVFSTAARAQLANPGFESGAAVQTPQNATTAWVWSFGNHGERVNALTNSASNIGDGAVGTHLIDPFAGSWFGYAENSSASGAGSVNLSQGPVLIDAEHPVLTFWWRFFTNESTDGSHNDLFKVEVDGTSSVSATVATVTGTPMITTNGPLFSPLSDDAPVPGTDPGQNQSFASYTAAWAFYSLDVSALAGQNATVYFFVNDAGGGHSESSGFALDNVQFEAPEPASVAILAVGGMMILRRRHHRV